MLALWPLVSCRSGIEVSDSTYSLANFLYLKPDYMWYFATFLANRTGTLLTKLPGGGSLLAMNVKAGLLLSAAAVAVYLVLKRWIPSEIAFAAEWIAIAIFWSPHVSLYNTLTYVLLTLACLLLLEAMRPYEVREEASGDMPRVPERLSSGKLIKYGEGSFCVLPWQVCCWD